MPFDITFQLPFNCLVAGSSGSGKTTWVRNVLSLRHKIFSTVPARVFWFYAVHQPIYLQMKREGLVHELLDVTKNMPTYESIADQVSPYKNRGGSIVVFDDCLSLISKEFENIFCRLSHHENLGIFFMTQNLMYQSPIYRTMSLNAHYFVVMKTDRALAQVGILGKQICPENIKFIIQGFVAATRKPYSYLVLDIKPETKKEIRLRYRIFPHEFPTVCIIELPDYTYKQR